MSAELLRELLLVALSAYMGACLNGLIDANRWTSDCKSQGYHIEAGTKYMCARVSR